MRVVRAGKVKIVKVSVKQWRIKVVCAKKDKYDTTGCRAKLEIAAKDLVMMCWYGSFFPHYYLAAQCPLCGKYNMVGVPDSIWEKLDTAESRRKAIWDGFSDGATPEWHINPEK